MRKSLYLLASALFFIAPNILLSQSEAVLESTNREELNRLSEIWKKEQIENLIKATEKAEELGLDLRQEFEDGSVIEIQGLDERGQFIYYKTDNRDAARTISADDVYPGGALGLSFTGSTMTIGEWDGGAVRLTHQELANRVSQVDSSTNTINHATHVAGTLVASGVDSSARGMSYAASLDAYDWNFDASEMASAAANGLLISNHSYGSITGWYFNSIWYWYGDTTLSANEDYRFGFYDSRAAAWDQIARNAPYYLIVKSAGNDRGDSNITGTNHYLPQHAVFSTSSRNADGGPQGYDCISTYSGAKNILTVGAVNAIPGGYSSPSSVVMSNFSGWGPTDDGRIKPDVVANGVGVYSSLATNDSAYASYNGTSMAAPSAAGALLLLQELYEDENNVHMKSATLKGLAIHTADEAGAADGPDYIHGWGLLNIGRAAEHILDSSGTKSITESSLSNSNTYNFNITVNGFTPIRTTLSWTDLAGTPVSAALDPSNAMLVNDLDIRIIRDSDSTVYYPYILNPSSPANAATTGDNFRDNVEQIYIASPVAGSYTVIVSHKGTLSGGSTQDFSLIIDGGIPPAQPLNCSGIITAPAYWDFDTLTNCSATAGSACIIPSWYGWSNDTLDNIDWTVRNGGTPSTGTGPSNDYNTGNLTGKYLYTEASTNNTGYPNKEAILYSPCISLDTMTNSELFFAYHMSGSNMGTLSAEVFNGFAWNSVWSVTGNQDTSWLTATADLSLYDGDTIILRFVGTTGNGFESDIAIDAVEIREFESCPGPSNFAVSSITDTTAIFSWSSNASFWKVRLEIKDSITVIPTTTINYNPVLFSGLIPNTTYDIYIQDSCGLNDTSAVFGPITFTTSGPIFNPTPCGLNAGIPDNTCPSIAYLPFEVTYSGSQLGTDAFLKEARVIIEHTYDADLQFGLVSPGNDTVMLSIFNGGAGDNFGNPNDSTCSLTTNFSMTAATSITSGTAPFIGTYLPQQDFSGFYNGSNPNGTWKFIICDGASGDIGALDYLELVFDSVAPSNPLACSNVINSFPSTWDFDTLSNCSATSGSSCVIPSWYGGWVNDTTDNIDWTVWSGGTNSLSTGPTGDSSANGGGKYLYTEASSNGTGFPGKQANLLSPCFNLSSLSNPILDFAYHMNGSSMGTMRVEVSTGGTFTQLWSRSGNLDTLWHPERVDLSAYSDDTVQFRFVGLTGTNYFSDMAIDAITVGEKPPCLAPANLQVSSITDSTAFFSWSSSASFHRIRLDLKDSITLLPPTTINYNPLYWINLQPNTTYSIYIQDSCGFGDTSAWVGPFDFTTTGPLSNPSACNVDLVINDQTCPVFNEYRVEVATQGNSMGSNVFLNEVKMILEHTNDFDLTIALESPSNDTIVLSSNNGASGNHYGDPFDQTCTNVTTFTRIASTNITAGVAPFTASYHPEDSLQRFDNGTDPNGIWKLLICDAYAVDSGSVKFVELVFDSIPNTVQSCSSFTVGITPVGSTSFCNGDSAILISSPGVTYQWYQDGSAMTGETNDTLIVFNTGNYNVLVTDTGVCFDSAAVGVQIESFAIPIVSISASGPTTICSDDSLILDAGSYQSYQWYKDGISLTGETDSVLNVTSSGNYNVVVTDSNLCSDSSANSVAAVVNPIPIVSITGSGSPAFCDGDSIILTATAPGSYQWLRNGQSIVGATAQTFIARDSASYNVLVTDSNNCSDSSLMPLMVTVFRNPVFSISVSPDSVFCQGDSAILSVPPTYIQYQWFQNGLPLLGQNTFTFVAKNVGRFNARVTNGNNCSDTAKAVEIVVNPLPFIAISTADSSICVGDSTVISATPGYSYSWRRNGMPYPGQGSDITVTQGGYYNVVATTNAFCSDTASSGIRILEFDLPVVSLDSQPDLCNTQGETVLSGGQPSGGRYTGPGVSGNSGQFFIDPAAAGVGTITITYTYTDSNSCTDSDEKPMLIKNCVGIDELGNSDILFYPNPTKGILFISIPEGISGEGSIQVYDAGGQLIQMKDVMLSENQQLEVDLSREPSGVYFVHLRTASKSYRQKVILEQNF